MKVPFEQLPDSSKVWVYQSSRRMSDEEVTKITDAAEQFVDSWTAHQAGLKSGTKVLHNYFIVIAVDESYNNASGCSIDKQVHFIQSQGELYGIDFFNRMNVVCKVADGNFILTPVSDLDRLLEKKTIGFDTVTYNNLVDNIHDFKSKWEVQISDSWVTNFIAGSKA